VAAVALLLLGGGLWWLWPDESPTDSQAPGRGSIGVPDGTASVGTAAGDAAAISDPSGLPGTTPPVTPPDVRKGTLLVRTEIPQAGPLTYTVRLTISNGGDTSGSWRSVSLRLSGVNLTVTPAGTAVRYEFRAPAHCLVAASPVALSAGESISLEVTVTAPLGGVLGGVESARLDEAPCPT
jgi:hypothetical protein